MNPKEVAKTVAEKAKEMHVRFPKIWNDAKILQTCGATLLTYRTENGFDDNATLAKLVEIYGIDASSKKPETVELVDTDDEEGEKMPSRGKSSDNQNKNNNSPKAKSYKTKARVIKDEEDDEESEEGITDFPGSKKTKKGNEASPKKRKSKSDSINSDPKKEDGEATSPSKKARKPDHVANEKNRPLAEAIKEIAVVYFKNGDPRKGGVFSKAAKAIRDCESYVATKKEAMALKGIGQGIAGYAEEFIKTGMIEKLEELRAGIA